MAKEYSWAEIRDKAARDFGGAWPDAQLEQDVVERFRDEPARVLSAIADVANAYKAGRVHAPWPFLRKQLQSSSQVDVVVSDEGEKRKAISLTQQWIKATGLHVPNAAELFDELFGPTGKLKAWDSPELRQECLTQWQQVRPAGEALEREAVERIVAQVDAIERTGRRMRGKPNAASAAEFAAPVRVEDWAAA